MKAISLLYHDVVNHADDDSSGFPGGAAARYKLEVGEFENHLKAIAGIRRDKPVDGLDILMKGETGEIPFLLTFDDGGSSACHIAEILADLGWLAHFFITVDYIGAPSFVSAEQIRALRRMGHVIGSHSCSHPERMSYCSLRELVGEWARSMKILSDIIGEPVLAASVPGGYYSRKVGAAASVAGIKVLFNSEPVTKCHYVDGCLVLGRYTILKGMGPQIAAGLAAGQLSPRLRQFLYWNMKKIPKTLGGELYVKARDAVFDTTTTRRI